MNIKRRWLNKRSKKSYKKFLDETETTYYEEDEDDDSVMYGYWVSDKPFGNEANPVAIKMDLDGKVMIGFYEDNTFKECNNLSNEELPWVIATLNKLKKWKPKK